MTRKLLILLGCLLAVLAQAQTVRIVSQTDLESQISGQIARKILANAGLPAEHTPNVANDHDVYMQLTTGKCDVGVLKLSGLQKELATTEDDPEKLNIYLKTKGFGITFLGYDRGYGFVLPRITATVQISEDETTTITSAGELKDFPQLLYGAETPDIPLAKKALLAYGLKLSQGRECKPAGSLFKALDQSSVNVVFARRTDPKITDKLVVLDDSLQVFEREQGVLLYKLDNSTVVKALSDIAGFVDGSSMRKMVLAARQQGNVGSGASLFFSSVLAEKQKAKEEEISRHKQVIATSGSQGPSIQGIITSLGAALAFSIPALQHIGWMLGCLLIASLLAYFVGVYAVRRGWISRQLLGGFHLIHFLPVLGILGIAVSAFGPAKSVWILATALTLGAVWPLLQGFVAGVRRISPGVKDTAEALGLSPKERLRHIYVPLASPTIVRGLGHSIAFLLLGVCFFGLVNGGGLGQEVLNSFKGGNDRDRFISSSIQLILLGVGFYFLYLWLEKALVPKLLRERHEIF